MIFPIDLKFNGKILTNAFLAPYTSFKIGGKVDYLVFPYTWNDVFLILEWAKKEGIPFKIMGQGSNILVPDEKMSGIVIKINRNLGKIKRISEEYLEVEAGCLLSDLLSFLMKNNLGGLEFLVGIPGNIGGSVFGNSGAFGNSIGEFVKEVVVIDENLNLKILKNSDLFFSYRKSNIKEEYIIKSVLLKVNKQSKEKTYNLLLKYLRERQKRIPKFPSAGSIFKNPPNVSAGYLLEKVGMKGKRVGNVMVSHEHANIIINLGGGKAKEVKELINIMKDKVKDHFNVDLDLEIKIW
ncbi:MAG: UDP-N-acetylmuramate dehydrogenase [Dictyoglomus sp.]|nr:UDP-N-acetylmuramate dehydrogenase [Dictyoglomus sp.]MCX7942356.1 UDP-N-acetylmuramate dehydrogenase [Dictyoglomaceae bacterium]MDW8188440.1 UDP-N-acetylmuramate dehydrogenase [Dictyoglomus sp.]